MSDDPTVRFLADTGYLICFGAMPGGRGHFLNAFARSVAASPTVRHELIRKHADRRTSSHLRSAIDAFIGRHHDTLLDVAFEQRDEVERDRALAFLRKQGNLPVTEPDPIDESDEGRQAGRTDTGEHGGEAEIVAIALRRSLPLLMNDSDGRRYARARRIEVEPFAQSLKRLVGVMSAREVYKLWQRVDQHHDTGAVVPGASFFRQPPPSSRAAVL